ncbi:DUF2877 domain-containing protein [Cytobacillus dafuensis]|uniref:DUF2877 domain-containing protein n=1 Tax=Cytobacillus dafuensis TaxID=1742359 RepID=A0A5B8Z851_CYTDA|nr:DUF2877 domain-containing protein [Cytobacillus dafuensis]QED49127.1 DUF2877 domain-containing protein [Cytobacillus dafuensis]
MKLAISGDDEFIERIEDCSFRGFVHSVFNCTFNIRNLESDELFTIVCKKTDNGPNTLVVDVEDFKNTSIEVNDPVMVMKKSLHIGDKLHISIRDCEKWESILPDFPKEIEMVKRNLNIVKDYIEVHGKSGGVKPDSASNLLFSKEVSRILDEQSRKLIHELLNGRISNALNYAVSLIGLGPGLTPSGDDFLVGLFTIMNIKNCYLFSNQSFCEEVVKKAKALTNDISYMALKKASIGKVRESIIQLVHAIMKGKDEELILSLNKVLNIGSSSGTDIALGLVCGLEANIKAGGKL